MITASQLGVLIDASPETHTMNFEAIADFYVNILGHSVQFQGLHEHQFLKFRKNKQIEIDISINSVKSSNAH